MSLFRTYSMQLRRRRAAEKVKSAIRVGRVEIDGACQRLSSVSTPLSSAKKWIKTSTPRFESHQGVAGFVGKKNRSFCRQVEWLKYWFPREWRGVDKILMVGGLNDTSGSRPLGTIRKAADDFFWPSEAELRFCKKAERYALWHTKKSKESQKILWVAPCSPFVLRRRCSRVIQRIHSGSFSKIFGRFEESGGGRRMGQKTILNGSKCNSQARILVANYGRFINT